jgi:hypothetical protein
MLTCGRTGGPASIVRIQYAAGLKGERADNLATPPRGCSVTALLGGDRFKVVNVVPKGEFDAVMPWRIPRMRWPRDLAKILMPVVSRRLRACHSSRLSSLCRTSHDVPDCGRLGRENPPGGECSPPARA